jgi:hypothetical protein
MHVAGHEIVLEYVAVGNVDVNEENGPFDENEYDVAVDGYDDLEIDFGAANSVQIDLGCQPGCSSLRGPQN